MPSDASKAALAALEVSRERFLSAVATAAEELRGYLSAHAAPGDDRSARVAMELGPFAGGRVSAERFARFLGNGDALDPAALRTLELARSVLDDAANLSDRSFLVELPSGSDLHSAVGLALAWLGRAFGAATEAERARRGDVGSGDPLLVDAFPFRRWTRGERSMAPPLVVEVQGSDLNAGGLAPYLDGAQKLVLVVRAPAPPAPLARLVSPGVLVLQTDRAEALRGVDAFEGPAVAALMPEGQGARFVHDPGLGSTLARRLVVSVLPEENTIEPLGTLTRWQQLQELGQLAALKEAAEGAGTPVPAAVAANGEAESGSRARKLETVQPADQLAGWLLSQADLGDM